MGRACRWMDWRNYSSSHPKLIYTIPNFHNPTGTCLNSPPPSTACSGRSMRTVPILEDDFVGDLRYEGRTQPALKALDPGGRVIYVSTFSKMLMPGLQVGFLVAEGPVYDSLVDFKRVNELATSNAIQRAGAVCYRGSLPGSSASRSCQIFRKRRDVMVAAIQRFLSASVHFDLSHGADYLSGWRCQRASLLKNCFPLPGRKVWILSRGARSFQRKQRAVPGYGSILLHRRRM